MPRSRPTANGIFTGSTRAKRIARYHAAKLLMQAVGRGEFQFPGLDDHEKAQAEREITLWANRVRVTLGSSEERRMLGIGEVAKSCG